MSKEQKRRPKNAASTGKLQLIAISLVESASKLGQLKVDQLPGHATQAVSSKLMFNEKEKAAFVNIRIKLDASYDGDKTKEPAVSILASFVARYSIVEDFADNQLFQRFTQQLGMANVWPFWREFAQSMTTRMGLPAFPVPLVNTAELTQNDEKP